MNATNEFHPCSHASTHLQPRHQRRRAACLAVAAACSSCGASRPTASAAWSRRRPWGRCPGARSAQAAPRASRSRAGSTPTGTERGVTLVKASVRRTRELFACRLHTSCSYESSNTISSPSRYCRTSPPTRIEQAPSGTTWNKVGGRERVELLRGSATKVLVASGVDARLN